MAPAPTALLFPIECGKWEEARSLSYVINFGIEEGLAAHGYECTMVPTLGELTSESPGSWTRYIRDLLRGKTFDQVWIWLAHSKFDPTFWRWLEDVAPVRIGFLMESMNYPPSLSNSDKFLEERSQIVKDQLRHLTHALVVDEADEAPITKECGCVAKWWPSCIPSRWIAPEPKPPRTGVAAFHGVPYYFRQTWLQVPELHGRLVYSVVRGEEQLGKRFDALHESYTTILSHATPRDFFLLHSYVHALRTLRAEIFGGWLNSLGQNLAVVNLPTICQCYASRVVEGMASGRPVIAWEVPERARNRALFDEGKEILTYRNGDYGRVAHYIERLGADPSWGNELAEAAMKKVRKYHTTEARIGEVLAWIQAGGHHENFSCLEART